MREEDKVLLFAEIMGLDVKPYVEKYVEELRSSDIFLRLCKNVATARSVNSFRAQRLIDEFEMIDFSKIDSLRSLFSLDAKINYLVTNSEASSFINPFFYHEDSDNINYVGEITIEFDKKQYTINDMILDERYTTKYKIDYIKECYLEWRKEVNEKVIGPFKNIAIQKEKLPSTKLFSSNFKWLIFSIVLLNFAFFMMPLIPIEEIQALYQSSSPIKIIQYIFYFTFFLMVFVDLIIILIMAHRYKKTYRLRSAMRLVDKADVTLAKIDNKCAKIYDYILRGISEKKLLGQSIKKFCIPEDDLTSIAYLMKLGKELSENKNNQSIKKKDKKKDKKVQKSDISFVLKLLVGILGILLLIIVGYILFVVGGR